MLQVLKDYIRPAGKSKPNRSSNKIEVIGLVKSKDVYQDLHTCLTQIPGIFSKVIMSDWWPEEEIIGGGKKKILLLEADKENIVESIQAFHNAHKNTQHTLVILSPTLKQSDTLKLLRIGVSDFINLPLSSKEVHEVILRLIERDIKNNRKNEAGNKIITFTHASGGMGSTTLAVNTATIINAASGNHNTACLLDFDLQYGGASVQLDLPGYSPVLDLLDKPERLDRDMLEAMMMRHSSGLRVLTTPEAPLPVEAISSDVIGRLLSLAENRFQYVVVDMPQTLTLWTDTVFRKSKVIYVVMQLSVPSIRQLQRWFAVLEQEKLHNLPIKIVVNRVSPINRIRHDTVSIAQASEALGRKIDYVIPNDYGLISYSLDQGMAAATLNQKSKFTRQMKAMLQDVVRNITIP